MEFRVNPGPPAPGSREGGVTYLWPTGWDDWFKFSTSHQMMHVDEDGQAHMLGVTKIGQFGLKSATADAPFAPGYRVPDLPREFSQLDDRFFSLGQDTSFYEGLTEIGAVFRESLLQALHDIAYESDLRGRAQTEDVTRVSLLRDVPLQTVQDQYHRLARGGVRLTPYNFRIVRKQEHGKDLRVSFSVQPDSKPPTNIHVLVGRNNVGKSTMLNDIARTLVSREMAEAPSSNGLGQLSNLVSVSFSAFDQFEPITVPRDRTRGVTYHYVGLKKIGAKGDDPVSETKDYAALSREMTTSTKGCLRGGSRKARWLRALRLLEGDPIFASVGLVDLFEDEGGEDDALGELPAIFRRLSSGHKIVLLTMTRLVETVEEKSLVLIDEPEAHLHPPLLSAFVRALSDLLTNRNGIAIIATHSPVVLQEVPRSCVWKLHRSGNFVSAERPEIETFGENVGTLTDEVFGLEVVATGFHKMLAEAALSADSYESALNEFGGQLGMEGRAILRSMMIEKSRGQNVAR